MGRGWALHLCFNIPRCILFPNAGYDFCIYERDNYKSNKFVAYYDMKAHSLQMQLRLYMAAGCELLDNVDRTIAVVPYISSRVLTAHFLMYIVRWILNYEFIIQFITHLIIHIINYMWMSLLHDQALVPAGKGL
jgi:hypothetical protein